MCLKKPKTAQSPSRISFASYTGYIKVSQIDHFDIIFKVMFVYKAQRRSFNGVVKVYMLTLLLPFRIPNICVYLKFRTHTNCVVDNVNIVVNYQYYELIRRYHLVKSLESIQYYDSSVVLSINNHIIFKQSKGIIHFPPFS